MMTFIAFIVILLIILLLEKSLKSFMLSYAYEDDIHILVSPDDFENFQEKRYHNASRVLLLLLVLPFLDFNKVLFILICFVSFYEYKRSYLKLKTDFKNELSLIRYQFPIWLRQIQILLYSNNVLNALILSMDSAPLIIKEELNKLVSSLQERPNDLSAFTNFMSDYKISEVDRAMKLLYRTYLIDQEDTSKQLNRMVASTTKWIRFERQEKQKSSLKVYEWIGIIPLFGVTLVFLVIMASLLNNLGGKGVGL